MPISTFIPYRISMKSFILFMLLVISCVSCDDLPNPPISSFQEISGRDEGKQINSDYLRSMVYRSKVPLAWHRSDPQQNASIADTTKPLCEFAIEEGSEIVRITIHNFPTIITEERIPPGAQVARWKRQFTELDVTTVAVTPQSYGGFAGLFFEGTGMLGGENKTVMAWAMQLAPGHYSTLSYLANTCDSVQEREHLKQVRSDYTIKAVGPKTLMEKHRHSLIAFARSFELIDEIPHP